MNEVGTFDVTSGKLRVTDPCYDPGTKCAGTLTAKNGRWKAFVVMSDQGSGWLGGRRVSELHVYHEDNLMFEPRILTNIDVGVDSGQAGFFDEALFNQNHGGKYGDENSFYGRICSLTHSEDPDSQSHLLMGGTIEWGAASSSGFGDGGYQCFVHRDTEGVVVSAKIVYISDEPFEDEEDEEDEDDNEFSFDEDDQ